MTTSPSPGQSGTLCHLCGQPLSTEGCVKGATGYGHVTVPQPGQSEAVAAALMADHCAAAMALAKRDRIMDAEDGGLPTDAWIAADNEFNKLETAFRDNLQAALSASAAPGVGDCAFRLIIDQWLQDQGYSGLPTFEFNLQDKETLIKAFKAAVNRPSRDDAATPAQGMVCVPVERAKPEKWMWLAAAEICEQPSCPEGIEADEANYAYIIAKHAHAAALASQAKGRE